MSPAYCLRRQLGIRFKRPRSQRINNTTTRREVLLRARITGRLFNIAVVAGDGSLLLYVQCKQVNCVTSYGERKGERDREKGRKR
jgi:hypothetical protein